MAFRNKTHTSRWLDEDSYELNWTKRGQLLLNMFVASELEEGHTYRVSEYGCGANAPIARLCADDPRFEVTKYDIRQWDEATVVRDLNRFEGDLDPADIAVFSGVLEYLDDVPAVLKRAIMAHRYVLLSYAFVSAQAKASDRAYLGTVRARATERGWRNHFSSEDIVGICSSIGVISNAGLWADGQALFLVRRFESAS